MVPCDIDAVVETFPYGRLLAEEVEELSAEVARAAACSPPIAKATAQQVATAMGWRVVDGPPGSLQVLSDTGLWATIDGVQINGSKPIPAGTHLVQVGGRGDPRASVAWIEHIEPGEPVVVAVTTDWDGSVAFAACDDLPAWRTAMASASVDEGPSYARLGVMLMQCPGSTLDPAAIWPIAEVAGHRGGDLQLAAFAGRRSWDLRLGADPRRLKAAGAWTWAIPIGLGVGLAGGVGVVTAYYPEGWYPLWYGGTALALVSATAATTWASDAGVPVTTGPLVAAWTFAALGVLLPRDEIPLPISPLVVASFSCLAVDFVVLRAALGRRRR